jgi:hypothetical protein
VDYYYLIKKKVLHETTRLMYQKSWGVFIEKVIGWSYIVCVVRVGGHFFYPETIFVHRTKQWDETIQFCKERMISLSSFILHFRQWLSAVPSPKERTLF